MYTGKAFLRCEYAYALSGCVCQHNWRRILYMRKGAIAFTSVPNKSEPS